MWWALWSLVCLCLAMIYYSSLEPDLPEWAKPLKPGGDVSVVGEALEEGVTNISGWKVVRQGYAYELHRQTETAISRKDGNMPVEVVLMCANSTWHAKVEDAGLGADINLVTESKAGVTLVYTEGVYYSPLEQATVTAMATSKKVDVQAARQHAALDTSQLGNILQRLPPCVQLKR